MVCRVTGRDGLKGELGDEADDTGIARLERCIVALVHQSQLVDEGLYDDLRGIEHRKSVDTSNLVAAEAYFSQQQTAIARAIVVHSLLMMIHF